MTKDDIGNLIAAAHDADNLGDRAKARTLLAQAIEASPRSGEAHGLMAWCALNDETLGPAERERLSQHHLAVAKEAGSQDPFGAYWSGRVLAKQGNAARARAEYALALAARPDFEPARKARDELDAKGGSTPGPLAFEPPPRRLRGSRTRTVVLGVVTVLLVAAAVGIHLLPDPEGLRDLAGLLGTRYTLISASRSPPELMIDVGGSWESVPPDERPTELRTIGERALAMGFETVIVYSSGHRVAEAHGNDICAAGDCMVQEKVVKRADGTVQVTLTPPRAK